MTRHTQTHPYQIHSLILSLPSFGNRVKENVEDLWGWQYPMGDTMGSLEGFTLVFTWNFHHFQLVPIPGNKYKDLGENPLTFHNHEVFPLLRALHALWISIHIS